jgi:hypothetical protein
MKVEKFKFHQNTKRMIGSLHEHLRTFMIISGSVPIRKINISGKTVEKTKIHILSSVNILQNRAGL